jgi:Cu/Ag efflux protein CusF
MQNNSRFRLVILTICVLCASPRVRAEEPPVAARSIAFFGRVEAVRLESKILIVKHGRIPGYMESATTEHFAEGEAILKGLRPGDNISATVHPNDLTLYHLQLVFRPTRSKGMVSK